MCVIFLLYLCVSRNAIGELVNFPHRMDTCPCGILQTVQGGEEMEKKKEEKLVVPPPPPTGIAHIITDPFGSYTGLVPSLDEKPVQDADDL